MSRVRYYQLTDNEKKKYLGEFYSMVAILKDREEVKKFFKDLLTLSEVVMISRRIQVARMLLKGQTYEEIRKKLKVGIATIVQVEKWVNNGFGSYKSVIKKFKEKYPNKNDFEKYGYVPFSKKWTRKKYPLHYLLINLISKK